MQVTDELRVLVEAEVAQAIENFKKLGGSLYDAEQKTQSLGDALDSISKKTTIISAVIDGAGIAAVKFAGENEKLKLSLKNMLGSADEATAVFEDWRRLGASPGLSATEVFDLGRAMVNMGHDTAYATQTIQMLGNVSAGTGKSFGTVSGAFEHARAQGKLTTRELVNFQQQGIPVLKQLAKELGTSEEGVRQLAAQGKIGFSELERAFQSMTGPGGQFAGMMDELSGTAIEKFNTAVDDAKQALASFGELMLPMATELLDSASSIMRSISNMDEGTKRFVIGMGGIIAVSGPAISAIKGIHAAFTMLAANPIILVGAGAAAALVGLFAVANDFRAKMDQVAKDYDASVKEIINSNQKLIKNGSFEEARRQIRGLTRDMYDAAQATGNYAAAVEAAERLVALNQRLNYLNSQADRAAEGTVNRAKQLIEILEMPVDPSIEITNWVDEAINGFNTVERKLEEFYDNLHSSGFTDLQRILEFSYPGWAEAVASNSVEDMIRVLKSVDGKSPEVKAEIERIKNEILELGNGVTVRPFGNVEPPSVSEIKKRWQDWYGEITKIDPASFGNSGARAAELYIAGFSRSFEAGKTVFTALGEEFDIAESLRSRQGEIQKALVEMFSINPDDIDRPFEAADRSVQRLIAEYKRLTPEIKTAEDAMKASAAQKEYVQKIEDMRQKIADIGKSEIQLARDTAIANKALSEQADEIAKLTGEFRRAEIIADYDRQIKELKMTEKGLAMAIFEATGATEDQLAAFSDKFDLRKNIQQAKELEETLKGIKDSLVNLGAGAVLGGIEALGSALGQGANAGDAMQNALVAMSQEILNALPNLFLQAGLQLIAQGQWPLGLGFVAAAGSTAMIKGYVGGRIEAEQNAAKANAHGNIFDADGIYTFTRGGTFTNQIVQTPTLFKFARGTGLMGEAGPEAIVPLKRMANGDLGVTAASGGNVVVNIINNSGAEVHRKETETADGGKQIDITIGEMINRHITSGKADRAMGRYGLRAAGV